MLAVSHIREEFAAGRAAEDRIFFWESQEKQIGVR